MYMCTVSVHTPNSVHYVYNDTGWALSFVVLQFHKKRMTFTKVGNNFTENIYWTLKYLQHGYIGPMYIHSIYIKTFKTFKNG